MTDPPPARLRLFNRGDRGAAVSFFVLSHDSAIAGLLLTPGV
jgi:hypothetical protein